MADTLAFDEATFNRLIAFITECKDQLDEQILAPTKGLMISDDLQTFLKPGAKEWKVVEAILAAAGAFGGSTRARLTAQSKEWGEFIRALTDARDALKKGDDLATMSASEFIAEFPVLGPPSGGLGAVPLPV
jgi:hypothetical protein